MPAVRGIAATLVSAAGPWQGYFRVGVRTRDLGSPRGL